MKVKSKKPLALYIGSPDDSVLLLSHLMEYTGFEVVGITYNEKVDDYIEKVHHLDLVVLDLFLFVDDDFNKVFNQYIHIKSHLSCYKIPLILFTRDNRLDEELVDKVVADKHIKFPIDSIEIERIFREYLPNPQTHD